MTKYSFSQHDVNALLQTFATQAAPHHVTNIASENVENFRKAVKAFGDNRLTISHGSHGYSSALYDSAKHRSLDKFWQIKAKIDLLGAYKVSFQGAIAEVVGKVQRFVEHTIHKGAHLRESYIVRLDDGTELAWPIDKVEDVNGDSPKQVIASFQYRGEKDSRSRLRQVIIQDEDVNSISGLDTQESNHFKRFLKSRITSEIVRSSVNK